MAVTENFRELIGLGDRYDIHAKNNKKTTVMYVHEAYFCALHTVYFCEPFCDFYRKYSSKRP